MALPPCQRPHAEALVIKAMRVANRASNAAIALKNAENSREMSDRLKREFAKVDARPRLAAWLVSSEVMPSKILAELKVDCCYIAGADGFVPAHVIMEIACRVLGVVSRSGHDRGFDDETTLHVTRRVNLPLHQKALTWPESERKGDSQGDPKNGGLYYS